MILVFHASTQRDLAASVRDSAAATLRPLSRELVAGQAEVHLHQIPVKPVSVSLREHMPTMKTFELILGWFGLGGHSGLLHPTVYSTFDAREIRLFMTSARHRNSSTFSIENKQ